MLIQTKVDKDKDMIIGIHSLTKNPALRVLRSI